MRIKSFLSFMREEDCKILNKSCRCGWCYLLLMMMIMMKKKGETTRETTVIINNCQKSKLKTTYTLYTCDRCGGGSKHPHKMTLCRAQKERCSSKQRYFYAPKILTNKQHKTQHTTCKNNNTKLPS